MISHFSQMPGIAVCLFRVAYRRLLAMFLRPLFLSHGRNFVFDPHGNYSFKNIAVGDDVYIGPGAVFRSSGSRIIVGSKVMFGPNATLIGGDHNTSVLGRFMYDVREKRPEDDLPIQIEDDVWVGCNATILKGVTIGRGAIVAAGAIVTEDVPPYSVVAGVPARVLRRRWTAEEIMTHEQELYPAGERLRPERLRAVSCGGLTT